MRNALAFVIAAVAFFGCAKNPEPDGAVSGTIETDETRLASRYGGRVIDILAQEGDTVKSNQTLIRLEAPELTARRDQVAAQLAEWKAGARLMVVIQVKAN